MSQFTTQSAFLARPGEISAQPILTEPGAIGGGGEEGEAIGKLLDAATSVVVSTVERDRKRRTGFEVSRGIESLIELKTNLALDDSLSPSEKAQRFSDGLRQITGNLTTEDARNRFVPFGANQLSKFRISMVSETEQLKAVQAEKHRALIGQGISFDEYKQFIEDLDFASEVTKQRFLLEGEKEASGIAVTVKANEFANRAILSESTDDIKQILKEARQSDEFRGLPEFERQQTVLEDAIKNAVETADRDAFERIVQAAPQLPKSFVNNQRNALNARELTLRSIEKRQAIQEVRDAAVDGSEAWKQVLRDRVRDGTLTIGESLSLFNTLTGTTQEQRNSIENEQKRSEIRESAKALSVNTPADSGGLSAITRPIPYVVNGQAREYSPNQLKEDVVNEVVDGIMLDESLSMDERIVNSLNYLAENGGLVYQRFAADMSSAAAFGLSGLTEQRLPDSAVRGFEIYRIMRQTNPQLLDKHFKGNEQASQFLDDWLVTERHILPGDTQAAAVYAQQANLPENRDQFATNFDSERLRVEVTDVANAFFSEDAVNTNDIRQAINRIATLQMRRLGVDYKEAAESAANILEGKRQVINGYWVNNGGRVLPNDAKDLLEEAVKIYVERNVETDGLTEDQLSVIPSADGSTWQIVDMSQGFPRIVPNVNDGIFTNSALEDLRKMRRDAELLRVIEDAKVTTPSEEVINRLREGERRLFEAGLGAAAVLITGSGTAPQDELERRREEIKNRLRERVRNINRSDVLNAIGGAAVLGTEAAGGLEKLANLSTEQVIGNLEGIRERLEEKSAGFEQFLRELLGVDNDD